MTMLPMFFYWNDSAFLPAYAVFAGLLAIGFRSWLRWRNRPLPEAAHTASPLADPYALAFLRGGAAEAVRAAVFVLLYRGLLERVAVPDLRRVPHAGDMDLRPLEKQVLAEFDSPRSVQDVLRKSGLHAQLSKTYGETLQRAGFYDRRGELDRRFYWCLVVLLFGVAGIRGYVALQMHYSGFALTFVAAFVAWFLFTPVRRAHTPLGRQALATQEQAHMRHRHRAGNVDEATWAAAAFGVAALSASAYPMVIYAMPPMRRQATSNATDGGSGTSAGGDSSSSPDGGWCSSDAGSSDGGSCGDSGGGGDGGGGSSD